MRSGQKLGVIGGGIAAAVIIAVVITMNVSDFSDFSDEESTTQIRIKAPTDKGSLDVELALSPFPLQLERETDLRIRFLQKDKDLMQQHIDYKMFIEKDGRIFETPLIHSNPGIAIATYTFPSRGNFLIGIDVEGILFQPIPPETAKFAVLVV